MSIIQWLWSQPWGLEENSQKAALSLLVNADLWDQHDLGVCTRRTLPLLFLSAVPQ